MSICSFMICNVKYVENLAVTRTGSPSVQLGLIFPGFVSSLIGYIYLV